MYCWVFWFFIFFFFFKQKTAYEMVGSDWSSDVCSSDLLALLKRPEKRRERAEVDRRRPEPDHVRDDPAHLARHHPQHRAARRDLNAHQLLGGEREADVVRHGREVVGAVGERDDLVVMAVLPQLFEAGMEIAEMGDHPDHGLAVELDHEPQHPVSRWVLRPEVDQHVLAREIGLRGRRIGGVADPEGYPDRLAPGVQARGRKVELDGALAHSVSGSLPRSPWRSRSFMSAGSSS